ncbi:hypothetical protein O181_008631 [Austropuccinia psidii MF-1]|uniref:Uncharacterized protein n=1 Tax=Austropuccinia psidii MF-1 TaxID=1389203 RepID=A0A9Q3BMV6_9BASI|nr:hypothetical protein [Austropuccinia psidii MF-1]
MSVLKRLQQVSGYSLKRECSSGEISFQRLRKLLSKWNRSTDVPGLTRLSQNEGRLGKIEREARVLQSSIKILLQEKSSLKTYSKRVKFSTFEESYDHLHKVLNGIFLQMQARAKEISIKEDARLKIPASMEMTRLPQQRNAEVAPAVSSSAGTDDDKNKKLLADLVEVLYAFIKPKAMAQGPLERKEVRGKLALEMCIFQAMGSMYSSQLVTKDVLRSVIFSSPTSAKFNLQLIADHLQHLYSNGYLDIWSAPHTLIPQFELITTEWKTAHLHNLLKTLEDDEKAHLVYHVLVELLYHRLWPSQFNYHVKQVYHIFDTVRHHHLFEPPLGLKATEEPSLAEDSRKELVSMVIKNMIEFYETQDLSEDPPEFSRNYYQTLFLLNHYVLHFARTYTTSPESMLVLAELKKDKLLDDKFELVQTGLKLHQYVNMYLDRESLSELPEDQKRVMTMQASKNSLEELGEPIKQFSTHYNLIKAKLSNHLITKRWIERNLVTAHYNQLAEIKIFSIFRLYHKNLWLSRYQRDAQIAVTKEFG